MNLPREEFDREALAIRNKLLFWRFANIGTIVIDPALADSGLEDRQNQIGIPLLSVARTPDARAAVVEVLKSQEADTAADRSDTLAGEVFRVVLAMSPGCGFRCPRLFVPMASPPEVIPK